MKAKLSIGDEWNKNNTLLKNRNKFKIDIVSLFTLFIRKKYFKEIKEQSVIKSK